MTVRAVPANLLGHAGKHYVIFELYLGGYLAALAPMGTTTSDVLVLDADGRSPGCAIQVKTRRGRGRRREWIMHQKHETLVADRYLYAFVDTGSSPPRRVHRPE